MLDDSREKPSADHALRVLVRIDTQLRMACLEVRGCLTAATYPTLATILTHTGTLGAGVSVNLLKAEHVERYALELLRSGADAAVAGAGAGTTLSSGRAADVVPVEILVPAVLPVCRLGPEFTAAGTGDVPWPGHALTNEEAAERAFLRRDPHVLAKRRKNIPAGLGTERPVQ